MSQRKMAIFVEGQTEMIFIKKLLLEIVGQKNIDIHSVDSKGNIVTLSSAHNASQKEFFVLLYNCHSDNKVKSEILDNRSWLINANYELVLGVRDIFPFESADIPRLEMGMRTGIPTKDIDIYICLARMEVEAWLVQEETHYSRIDSRLTMEVINNALGFNPSTDNAEDLNQPALTLKQIYQLVGKSYTKRAQNVERTVNAIDYEHIYCNISQKLPYLKNFLVHIDRFLQA